MKTNRLKTIALALIVATASGVASAADDIELPAPTTSGGTPLSEALNNRRSVRSFDNSKALSNQQLSDLLWSATGINRPEDGKRTNPTAINAQEISVYLFTTKAVYRFDHTKNALCHVVAGDHRNLIAGGQQFVMDAPVSVVIIADLNKFKRVDERTTLMAMADAGIVCQNINLFCAANGLATVPRATMDAAAIRSLLGLDGNHLPALNNPIGYEKKN